VEDAGSEEGMGRKIIAAFPVFRAQIGQVEISSGFMHGIWSEFDTDTRGPLSTTGNMATGPCSVSFKKRQIYAECNYDTALCQRPR